MIAFAVSAVTGDENDEEELPEHSPVVLTDIERVPQPFLMAAARFGANFESRFSRTARREYFMNFCHCGASFGDFFLHEEPGHAFFPSGEDEAAASVQVQEIDCTDPLKIDCWFSGWSSLCLVESGTMIDGKIDVSPR